MILVMNGVLLTVANVGDSDGVLDTGTSMLEVTCSHRIHTSPVEQARLKAAGCKLSQVQ
jgi:BRCA1-associated protein